MFFPDVLGLLGQFLACLANAWHGITFSRSWNEFTFILVLFAHICECGQKGKWRETLGKRQTDFKCEIIVQIFKESGSLKEEKKY